MGPSLVAVAVVGHRPGLEASVPREADVEYELSPKARELLVEASKDPSGMLTRGSEDEGPGSNDILSMTRRMSANLSRTGSAVSTARLGFHAHGRFFPQFGEFPRLDEGWDQAFMELVMGEFIVPYGGRVSFKVTPKGYAAARQPATT